MTKFKFSLLLSYVSYRESKDQPNQPNSSCAIMFLSYFPEGFSRKFLVGMCHPVLQILTLFQTKKCYFPHPFSDLEMVTKHNITCLHKTEIYVVITEIKTAANFEFILHFLSYFFGIETTNTLIHNRSSLVNHTRFQTKMGKIYTRFQTKTAQKPHPLGVARTHIAYVREYPSVMFLSCFLTYLFH